MKGALSPIGRGAAALGCILGVFVFLVVISGPVVRAADSTLDYFNTVLASHWDARGLGEVLQGFGIALLMLIPGLLAGAAGLLARLLTLIPTDAVWLAAKGAAVCFLIALVTKLPEQAERKRLARETAERQREERERPERERQQRDRQRRATDHLYDRVVNCVWCSGTGDAQYFFESTRYIPFLIDRDDEYLVSIVRSSKQADMRYEKAWTINDDDGSEVDVRTKGYGDSASCIACRGTGRALAYFEEVSEPCSDCSGTGLMYEETTVKKTIGVKHVKYRDTCRRCQGAGKIVTTKIHTRLVIPEEHLTAPFEFLGINWRLTRPSIDDIDEVHVESGPLATLDDRWVSEPRSKDAAK